MNDRDLLELAAKAAGLEGEYRELRSAARDHFKQIRYNRREAFVSKGIVWDPLTDDGDALRLAASLYLDVEWFRNLQHVAVSRRGFGENIGWVNDEGRAGALRRAITVVAAQIGKTL